MSRTNLRPIATVLATIVIMGLSIYGVLIAVARSGDERQLQIEEIIVQSALGQLSTRLGGILHQNASWSTAYDAMGDQIDPAWVHQQLVPDVVSSITAVTLIANARSNIVFKFDSRNDDGRVAAFEQSAELRALLSRALRAPTFPAVATTAFISMDDRFYLAAAQQITPDDNRADKPLAKHFVLGYLAPLNRTALDALQRNFHIAPITIVASPQRGLASVALAGGRGKPTAYLSWQAAAPGYAFANQVAPFALAVFVLMGVLQLAILKSWLKAAQHMRDEGVARTMFLANVSHELRTPLNAIIGFSECMNGQMFGPLNARYTEYANDILMSGRYLLGIVDDVLDLTQLNSTDAIALEPVTLSQAVSRPLRMLREYAKSDAITIDFSDSSEGSMVLANQKAISQLLLNLGSNAIKFSPCGAIVEILVRDKGPGFPPDKLRLIGQPFLQAHNATARKPGSGLGLAIVKTLTEKLGGELVVDSTPGEGTTAIARLPLHSGENSRQPAEHVAYGVSR